MTFDNQLGELHPDSPQGLAVAMLAAIDAGHMRRDELARQQQEEQTRRIRAIFHALVGNPSAGPRDERYLFGRISDAIAEGATSIQIPCGNASPTEMAAALRMIPGVRIAPFHSTNATSLQVAWSAQDAQAVGSGTAKVSPITGQLTAVCSACGNDHAGMC